MLDSVPVLVQNAPRFVLSQLDAARRHGAEQKRLLTRLESAVDQEESTLRRTVIERWIEAIQHNLNLLYGLTHSLELAADIVGKPSPTSPTDVPDLPPQYGFRNLHYLWADWTDNADSRRQRRVTLDALDRLIPPSGGNAVMLGAGTGRYAVEVAPRFDQMIALELCPLYAYLFVEIQHRNIEFYLSHAFSPASVDSIVERHVTVRPDGKDFSRTAYAVADALRMPLPDRSQDVVIAVYFMDVVPLRQLAPEIARVLRPGGRFVPFGPLRYHFDDPLDTLAPEEIPAVFERSGLTCTDVSWQDVPYFSSRAQAGRLVDRTGAWSFERREAADGSTH